MRRLVVDACAWIELVIGAESWPVLPELLRDDADIHIPALCDVEVVAGLRKLTQAGTIEPADAERLLDDYLEALVWRHGHALWLHSMLELRDNFTPYDAAYVVLARSLDATLVTLDGRLSRAARQLGVPTAP